MVVNRILVRMVTAEQLVYNYGQTDITVVILVCGMSLLRMTHFVSVLDVIIMVSQSNFMAVFVFH
jgi:hypothetical protein